LKIIDVDNMNKTTDRAITIMATLFIVFLGYVLFSAFMERREVVKPTDFQKLEAMVQEKREELGIENICIGIPQGGAITTDGENLFDEQKNPINLSDITIGECPKEEVKNE